MHNYLMGKQDKVNTELEMKLYFYIKYVLTTVLLS